MRLGALACLWLLAWDAGCAANPSSLRAERESTRHAAETLLENDASSSAAATRRAAFVELGAAGHRARSLLAHLSASAQSPLVRALALSQLMQLGDHEAGLALRTRITASDPALVDLAYTALDAAEAAGATSTRALLLEALSSPRLARRLAALSVLAHAAAAPELLTALAEHTRRDPDPDARASAVWALAAQGSGAADATQHALEDADSNVRSAALDVLAQLDQAHATPILAAQLAAALDVTSLEAARIVLRCQVATLAPAAQRVITSALSAEDPALRGRAAVTLRALPSSQHAFVVAAARAQLAQETRPDAQLALALALGVADPAARRALQTLSHAATVAGTQAALELARAADGAALDTLRHALRAASVPVRRSAVRALGQLEQLDELRRLLTDSDPSVRRVAAAALLSADS